MLNIVVNEPYYFYEAILNLLHILTNIILHKKDSHQQHNGSW